MPTKPSTKIEFEENSFNGIQKDSRIYKISMKKYASAAANYFLTRRLNPMKVKEGETLAIQDHVTKEVNRAIGFLIRNEEVLLREIYRRVLINEAKSDIMQSNMFNLYGIEKSDYEKLSQKNKEVFIKKLSNIEQKISDLVSLLYNNERTVTLKKKA